MFRDLLHHFRQKDPTTTIAVAFLVLVAAGFAVYASSFGNHLFWDDDDFFLKNTYVHDWSYFPKFFSENVISGSGILSNYWRPMLLTVFSVEWHLWGSWAPGWHVTNTCFHIADAFLLFLLLFALFRKRGQALLASLVFLLHPVQTEAVSYANSLGDSLSVFFILSGTLLYFYARETKTKYPWAFYLAALFAYIFAQLSKETAIIFPGLIFLVELFHPVHATLHKNVLPALRRFTPLENDQKYDTERVSTTRTRNIVNSLTGLAPFAILALGYVALRATVLNFQNSFNLYNSANVFTSSFSVRILTFCRSLVTYITLIFWPAELHMERSVPFVTSLANPLVILGALLFVSILSLIIYLYRKIPEVSFGLLWFLICLAPTSNIAVPINGVFYEHWLYLPLAGFAFAVFAFLSRIYVRLRSLKFVRAVSVLLLFVLFVSLSVRTIIRNSEWHDAITFYEQTIRYNSGSYRIWNNLGMAYADAGRNGDAERAYLSAIKLDSTVAVAYHNLGNLYRSNNRLVDSEANYLTALEKDPGFLFTYPQLLNLYQSESRKSDFEKLLAKYQAELALKSKLRNTN